jgi:hypothetical protein
MIQVAEKILLDEMLLDKVLAPMVIARLSDTVALVEPAKYDAAMARMRKLGHTPKTQG